MYDHLDYKAYKAEMDKREQLFTERSHLSREQQVARLKVIAEREAAVGGRDRAAVLLASAIGPGNLEELEGSPTETWTKDSLVAQRHFLVDWDMRQVAADWLVTPPNDMYPYANPGMAYAWQVGIAPATQDAQLSGNLTSYTKAEITVSYRTEDGENTEDDPPPSGATFIEEHIDPAIELISLDDGAFCWEAADGAPVDLGSVPAYRKLTIAYNVVLHGVPAVSDIVINYGGRCHSLDYVSRTIGWVFPEETLLYSPPTMNRTINTLGETTGWTLRIPWAFQPAGWNKFLDKTKLNGTDDPWREIYYAGGNRLIIAPPTNLAWFLP